MATDGILFDEEEKGLVTRAAGGDRAAFEELVRRRMRPAFGLAWHLVGDRALAEDICQEAFIILYRKIRTLRRTESFNAWFSTVIVNLSRRALRRRSRRMMVPGGENAENPRFAAPDDVVRHAADADRRTMISAAIRRLPPRQREVFVLKHLEGKKLREIATILGCREGTVKAHLFQAVRNLRRMLEEKPVPKI